MSAVADRFSLSVGWETTYDAEYLAVTELQADALVTVDPALAMKAKDLVPLANLDALTSD
jgi:predicted nucleic acid-binding protein